ncbi:MAG: transcription termination factor Rho, partial [Opitutales bacterium]
MRGPIMTDEQKTEQGMTVVEGVLDAQGKKTAAHLLDPKRGGKTTPHDPYLPRELVQRFKLRRGSYITGNAVSDPRHPRPKVRYIETVDGYSVRDRKLKYRFDQLTIVPPDEKLNLESKDGRMTTRVIDLFCPIGKGQRGLIVAPPRTGKTTLLQDIAKGVEENHPECHLMVLLVDERPEEV